MNTTTKSTTKKNEPATIANWEISQAVPYPDLQASGSYIEWRNAGTLKGSHGNKPAPLPAHFYAYLLPDEKPLPDQWNRTHLAGYEQNPAPLSFRGKTLGEVQLEKTPHYTNWRVRGSETPTPSEKEWLNAEILPQLLKAIDDNRDALKAAAVERIRKTLAERLATARRDLDRMETEAAAMLEIAAQ